MKFEKKYLAINAMLLAFLFLSISFNKEYLRPLYGDSHILGFILGCYPNFIASFIISLFSLKIALQNKMNRGRIIFYAASLLVFVMLTVEELKPVWGVSKTFDPFDILATGAGCILAILTFEFSAYKQNKKAA